MKDSNSNLIPFNQRSAEEHREISRKGGIRSGEARRKKREMIEEIKLTDIAMKEERDNNLKLIIEAIKILKEAKKADLSIFNRF